MREIFKKDEDTKELKINESLDRENRQPLGETAPDEDEEQVNTNSPRHKYKTDKDVSDNSYLEFGEQINLENNDDVTEDDDLNELENQAVPINDFGAGYRVEEINPDNTGIIGAASISGQEKKIILNREDGEPIYQINTYGESKSQTEQEIIRKELEEKYGHLETADVPDNRIRAEAYKNLGLNSKIDIRSEAFGESHQGDNLKTMPDRKKQRSLRSLIREFIKPSSN